MDRKFKHKYTGFEVEFNESFGATKFGENTVWMSKIPVEIFEGGDWEELFEPEFTMEDVLWAVNNWSMGKVDEEDIRKFLK